MKAPYFACALAILTLRIASIGAEEAQPISPGELLTIIKSDAYDKPALAARVRASFKKWEMDKLRPQNEKTNFIWATTNPFPVTLKRPDGSPIGDFTVLDEKDGLQVFAKRFENFQMLNWVATSGDKKLASGTTKIEHYDYTADSLVQQDVPKGTVTRHEWTRSQIFPGTWREYLVYVPAQYDPETPAAVMVFQDGQRHADPNGPLRATTVFDNLIHKGDMPVTIGIFINPGSFLNQKPGEKPRNRRFEYDTLSDAYSRFLLEEIIPKVGKSYNLSDDPELRAIAGGSSGGICAWTVAWERPDKFRKVLSWVGSFVDLEGGHNYPPMIRHSEAKPIRAFLLAGKNDLDNQFGNWPLANLQMESALKFAGYEHKFVLGPCFHGSNHAGSILPEMLRWLWKNHRD